VLRGRGGGGVGLHFTVVCWVLEPEVVERQSPVNQGPNRHPETIIPGCKLRTPTLQRVSPEFPALIDQLHTLTMNRRDLSLGPQPWTFKSKTVNHARISLTLIPKP
jgi:hypothetical protein